MVAPASTSESQCLLSFIRDQPVRVASEYSPIVTGVDPISSLSEAASAKAVVFAGVADPTNSDTDSDGIGDGDEFYNAMNPALNAVVRRLDDDLGGAVERGQPADRLR